MARALRRTAEVRDGDALDRAIELLAGALERVGPASNRPEAERRLAELYTRRSQALIRRSPAESVADLRAARALHDTQARREAQAASLLRQAMVLGGAMARGVEWERAKEAYREAMRLTPRDLLPALQLGDQARARKDWETWLSASEEAARRAPRDERPQVHIARALAHEGREDEALARLTRFLSESPESPAAWRELGHLERAKGRWGRARQAYQRAGGESSEDGFLLEGLAYVALEEERFELALDLAKRAVSATRRDKVAAVRALALQRMGHKQRSLREFEAAWGREESLPWLCDLALRHLEAMRALGKDADARLDFYLRDERLTEHAGLVVQVHHYGSSKRHTEATTAIRQIQRLRPSALDPRADRILSGWLIQWGTYDLPDFALELSIRAARASREDEDAAPLVMSGRILMRQGRHDEAWRALDAALEIHPTRVDLHHTRAELGGSSGRYELGVASGRRALELRADQPYVCIFTAWCLLGLGRSREALPLLDLAVSKLGDHAVALRAVARACAGEFAGAKEDLERGRAREPKSREVQITDALLLARGGDRAGAIKLLRAVLAEELYVFQKDLAARELARIEASGEEGGR